MKAPIQMYGIRVEYVDGKIREGRWDTNQNIVLGHYYLMKGGEEKHPPVFSCNRWKNITLLKGVFIETE